MTDEAAQHGEKLRERMINLVLTSGVLRLGSAQEAEYVVEAADRLVNFIEGRETIAAEGGGEPAAEAPPVAYARVAWTARADAIVKKLFPTQTRVGDIRLKLEPEIGLVKKSLIYSRAKLLGVSRPTENTPQHLRKAA